MPLPEVRGHETVWERLDRSVRQGRLASTFLFVGPPGIGKRTLALHMAQSLLCENTAFNELTACKTCPGCEQVAALTHPDLITISRPNDRAFIPVELFIGDREHRMRQGLCYDISLKPFRGGRKVAIIDDADYLNQEGANSLLKTLEEPPPDSVIILIGTSEQRQLPTIRSRCQIVRFLPLSDQLVAELLKAEPDITAEQIAAAASRAGGSLSRARQLLDVDMAEVQELLLAQLSQPDFDSVALAKSLVSFVEAAGKETPVRRERLRQLLLLATDFYREVMRQSAHIPQASDDAVSRQAAATERHWRCDGPSAAACLERCLTAIGQVDANANLATLVPAWIDDLAQLTHRAGQQ